MEFDVGPNLVLIIIAIINLLTLINTHKTKQLVNGKHLELLNDYTKLQDDVRVCDVQHCPLKQTVQHMQIPL